MFLKRYGLGVKFPINHQMVCLEQMSIIFENFDNSYYSAISKRGTFSPFLSLVILLLVLPSNFIVSGVKSSR